MPEKSILYWKLYIIFRTLTTIRVLLEKVNNTKICTMYIQLFRLFVYLNEKPNYWIEIFTFLVVNTFSHVKLTRANGTNPRAKHIGQRIRCSSELEALFSVCCVFRPQICGSDEMKRPTMMTAQQIPRPGETPDQ